MGLITCFSCADFWDNVSIQTGWAWVQRGSGFSEVLHNLVPTTARRASEYPLLQRCLLVVWVAWTKDGDLICADWASEKWLTLLCNSLLCFQHQSHQLSPLPCQWTCSHRRLQNCPFQKWTGLTVLLGGGRGWIQTNKQKKNQTRPPQHYGYWLSLCSPIAVHRAFASKTKQGTDVGWLKNLSLPLFYWLVTTEKFALIYFKSKWLNLHKTGGKSQFLMRMLNKDSV